MNSLFAKPFRVIGVVSVLAILLLPHPIRAAVITVNETADANGSAPNGKCSLREALIAANSDTAVDGCISGSGYDTIILPSGTYYLTIPGADEDAGTTGDLDITGNLSIIGAGAETTIIDGGGLDRVFHVDPACTGLFIEIKGVNIRNGLVPDSTAAADGGGIYNCGNLKISDTVVSGNLAQFFGTGGGIYNKGVLNGKNVVIANNTSYWGGGIGNSGTLMVSDAKLDGNACSGAIGSGGGIDSCGEATLVNVTVNNNTAPVGGGVRNLGTIAVVNSTVSNNRATLSLGGGFDNESVLNVTNSTISGNTAKTGGGGIANKSLVSLANVTIANNTVTTGGGGGIYLYNEGLLEIENSLLAYNSASGAKNSCLAPAGSITSRGYNLEDDSNTCNFGSSGDKITTDPLLGPLQDNGGVTFTHALLPGSPAIDAGNPAGCKAEGGTRDLLNDQRSLLRPADGDGNGTAICDMGAYESGAVAGTGSDLAIQVWGSPDPVAINGNLTYNILVTNRGPEMADGVVITDTLPPNVTFVSASVNNGVCLGSGAVKCYAGTLFKGDAVMPAIVVKPTAAGMISNTVTVTGNSPDPSVANNSATATTLTSGLLAVRRLAGTTPVGSYPTLQAALDDTLHGDLVEAMGVTLSGNAIVHSNDIVTLNGGYDATFSSRIGYTTIAGTLTVENGTVAVGYVKIQ